MEDPRDTIDPEIAAQKRNHLPTRYHKGLTIERVTHLLEVRGYTVTQVAKEYGCNSSSVSQFLANHEYTPGYLKDFKDNRSDILAKLQADLLNSIHADDIKAVTPAQKIVMYGILSDKEYRERQGADISIKFTDLQASYEEVRAKRMKLEASLGVSPNQIIDVPAKALESQDDEDS